MSLICCRECGKEISNKVKKCPHCGLKLKKELNKKRKIVLSITVAIFVCICIALLITFVVIPSKKYSNAQKYVNAGMYEKAIDLYKELKGYKDSENRIREMYYRIGESLCEKQKYNEALEAFQNSKEYEDAEEKIQNVKELIIKTEKTEKLNADKELLKKTYYKCEDNGTTLSNDGLSISVDASGEYDFYSLYDVKVIISELSLPDSLIDEMYATNSLMGRQKEIYGNFEVSWSYHPNSGLDVIFKIITK